MAPKAEEIVDIPFTKQMRKATRDVHGISDALINAKLGIALSDNGVWAEGLLVFYDVFAWLEGALDRLGASLVGELDIEGMRRRDAFEADLTFYLGADWQGTHVPRPAVRRYLEHLEQLEREEPHLLMAYVYHLYMGLLSGGQVLRRKRQLVGRLLGRGESDEAGNAVTYYGQHKIGHLKRQLAAAMDHAAQLLDDVTRERVVEESKQVFLRNNEIVATVRGANEVLLRKLRNAVIVVVIIVLLYWMLFR
ncbi:heme oxygenase-like [Pollicipes pollicipes]|uniref:heme oxygenase-like n=1 Tax=Pollicipes pollicipes TaxID=41117 RepID=UPI0018850BFC|nr:heme oxygenase-like [Pollicipes pollicipes]